VSPRAGAVPNWLVEASGIAATQFAIQGCRDTRPIADNGTATGRTRNRRVEFTLVPDMHDRPETRNGLAQNVRGNEDVLPANESCRRRVVLHRRLLSNALIANDHFHRPPRPAGNASMLETKPSYYKVFSASTIMERSALRVPDLTLP
jgi:hypothetical protein